MIETAPMGAAFPPSGAGSVESQMMFYERMGRSDQAPALPHAATVARIEAVFATELDVDWKAQAACRDVDGSLFYHPPGERGAAKHNRDADAVALCQQCPVKEPCLAGALRRREVYGVWGGTTEDERENAFDEAAKVLGSRATAERVNHFVFAGFVRMAQ